MPRNQRANNLGMRNETVGKIRAIRSASTAHSGIPAEFSPISSTISYLLFDRHPDLVQELRVARELAELLDEPFHRLDGLHPGEGPSEEGHPGEGLGGEEPL